MKMMERQFGSLLQQQRQQQQSTPETRRNAELSATRPPAHANPPPPPRTQKDGGWSVVVGRKSKKGRKETNTAERKMDATRRDEKTRPSVAVQKLRADRMEGAPKSRSGGSVKTPKRKEKTSPTVTLPRAPRTSAVTLTLNEGANMSYADVVTTARRAIPLGEIGVQAVTMKKAVTGAIVIRVPGAKDREKASILATRLAGVLDPTKVKVGTPMIKAELRITNVDISMDKKQLRQALALAAGCGSEDVQIGEIGVSRGGLGSAWIKCPAAGARKLAQAGKVVLGWSIERVSAIPKRPLQCFKCLELGHVRATCTSTEDRSHLCYRCGGSGHRARGCPASAPKCPRCERLGAPSGHRMGGVACNPPKAKRKRKRPTQQSAGAAAATIASGNENQGGNVNRAASPSAVTRRARRAQDLLLQTIRENRVALAVVAEPYRVPDAPNWIRDSNGSTAITWSSALSPPGALLDSGNGFVAVEWNRIAIVGIYISPNSGVAAFGDFLNEIGDCVRRCLPRQVLVLGDFNARSSQWGDTKTDSRGRMLTDWAATLGLVLVNRGATSTCVAWRGSSIVDITWATAELYRKIHG
ncbi:uncharacterized protein LOC126925908 [Bombus affinis]|uniref:uncharacterized protein LOC126925908 n=1 Tax=Bombus affinis TaxID=309941 RepID=UPI0021B7DF63|nr:uncharacterized protein LOC126925908 [Bombus affinis]